MSSAANRSLLRREVLDQVAQTIGESVVELGECRRWGLSTQVFDIGDVVCALCDKPLLIW